MYSQYALARVIHADRLARQHPPRRLIREAVGRSMVRIGARLADPNLRPVRSR